LLQIIRVRFWGLLDRQPIHPPQQLPREADLPPATTTAEGMASWHDQCESMSRALAGLPEDLREVVRLRLFEELAMPRIAERLGIGLSMARYRWRKGAESVRHALGGPHR
jgi:DNA-directed RNA polymerase specialized sigma24 family protein